MKKKFALTQSALTAVAMTLGLVTGFGANIAIREKHGSSLANGALPSAKNC